MVNLVPAIIILLVIFCMLRVIGHAISVIIRGIFTMFANILTLGHYGRRRTEALSRLNRLKQHRSPVLAGNAPGAFHPAHRYPMYLSEPVIYCQIPGCHRDNPVSARYCRHCGHQFPLQHQV